MSSWALPLILFARFCASWHCRYGRPDFDTNTNLRVNASITAHFEPFAVGIPTLPLLVICAYALWIPLTYSGHPLPFAQANSQDVVYAIGSWLTCPFIITFCCATLYRILFKNRVALWVGGDSIVYVHSLFRKIVIRDIRSINLIHAAASNNPVQISFDLSDGKTRTI